MREWLPINTAPRDGTVVELMADDYNADHPYEMRWATARNNPLVQRDDEFGIWEDPGGNFTWCESEGGPTHWRALIARAEAAETEGGERG